MWVSKFTSMYGADIHVFLFVLRDASTNKVKREGFVTG